MSDLNRHPMSTPAFWRRMDGRIKRQLRRVARPVRGVLAAVDANGKGLLAQLTARADESLSMVEIAQHFGFRSVAPADSEVVAIPIGGSSAHLVVIGEIDRSTTPPTLVAGEACIYSTGGAKVVVHANGTIEIEGSGSVSVSGTTVELNGPGAGVARIGDTVTVTGVDSMGGAITATGVISGGSATVQAG